MQVLKEIFLKALNACKDDSVLIIIVCMFAALVAIYLFEKGVILL